MSSSSSPTPQISSRKLPLPQPNPQTTSILYDPNSKTLSLRHSDSSLSLYTPFPSKPSSFPSPKHLPSPISSSTFLHLQSKLATSTLFVNSSPLLNPSSYTLLSFYILRRSQFLKIKVFVSSHKDLEFDNTKFGVVFRVRHGVSVKLSGGVNVFALYSVSNNKIWVFGVRLIGGENEGGEGLKLVKVAVIDCCCGRPVFTIRVLFGFLFLGEENGVRIFPIRMMIMGNGNRGKEKRVSGTKRSGLRNGNAGEKISDSCSAKLRILKLVQESRDNGAFFVAFEKKGVQGPISMKMKSICIEALSANYFVVLDSVGDVHLLSLPSFVQGSDHRCFMKQLTQTMKVLKLAVFPDVSTVTQTIWMSDGCHTLHRMIVSDLDISSDKTEKKDTNDKLIETSVTQAIFSSEKIQDIVPLGANAVLVLGQGNMFAYSFL